MDSGKKAVKDVRRRKFLEAILNNKMSVVGIILLAFFIVMAFLGPLVYKYDHKAYGVGAMMKPPCPGFPLGTDDLGRDVLGELIYGAKTSLIIGVLATFISMVIGTVVGICSGYSGGRVDAILMRITDAFLVLPWLPLMLVLAALLGPSLWNIVFVIGVTSWAGTARLVRAQTLSVKERPFVERARSQGAKPFYIMRKKILPNVFPLVFSNTVLVAAVAILSETTLSFLGMGDVLRPSWGMMLHFAFEAGAVSVGAYWFFVPPGLCIILLVLGFTFLGHSFDEILNPSLRRR
jgi:peptide/nickel transport system permease protein